MATSKIAPRQTRRQQQERTREELLAAAAFLFAEQGLGQTSVEAIAERAGYTRGAFYSNFESKDDIFLTLLEQRADASIAEVRGIYRTSSSLDEAIAGLRERNIRRRDRHQWFLLGMEFRLSAIRDAKARRRLAAILRKDREGYARAVRQQFEDAGLEPPFPVEDIAILLQVIDHGIPELQLIDPDRVSPDFFFESLAMLFDAASALSRERKRKR